MLIDNRIAITQYDESDVGIRLSRRIAWDTTMTFQIRVRRKEMVDSRGKKAGIIPLHLERRHHADAVLAVFPSKRVNVPVD